MHFRAFIQFYSWTFARTLVVALAANHYSAWHFLGWFWRSNDYTVTTRPLRSAERFVALLVGLGMLLQAITGVVLLVEWARFGTVGYWQFGVALLIAYPVVWAHVLALVVALKNGVYFLFHPKRAGRALVCTILESQVRRLRRRHTVRVVAVAGSIGKTSTKLSVARLLSQTKRVRYQEGNYNDRVTVPLVFFGRSEPSLFNVFAWFKTFAANNRDIRRSYPYDIVVVELGTDGPGFMREFAYLHPDITVVTGITPEHMEYFGTLDAVASEELTVFEYSKRILVNGDDVPAMYLAGRTFVDYSVTAPEATYYAHTGKTTIKGQKLGLTLAGTVIDARTSLLGEQGAKVALAAASVARMLNIPVTKIADDLSVLAAFSGRMQLLKGTKNSWLIDDTYNATPIAATAALDVLYGLSATQRIAILGSMNELGDYAPEAHREVGHYCNPKKLDLVVTIGDDAKRYLAPEAKANGCTVKSFKSPYDAGAYVLKQMQTGSVVLAKGSQNGVFAEEAVKLLLADRDDAAKLVRQSKYWRARKLRQFSE